MTKKIFNSIILTSLVTFLACTLFIMGILHDYFSSQLLSELKSEAQLAAQGVELMGEDYLKGVEGSSRLTWIAADGTVLYDSTTPASQMENHADREEVREALETGSGSSSRYSNTLSEKTVNYALRLTDGTVIRVSSQQYTVWVLLMGMLQPMIVVAVLVLLLAALLAVRQSRRIVKPINAIDLDAPEISGDYEELNPLLHKISRQNTLIRRQMDDLRRRQEEFRTITENMSEGLIVLGTGAEVLSYNSSAIRLLGTDKPEEGISALELNRSEPFRRVVEESLAGRHSEGTMNRGQQVFSLFANPVTVDGEAVGAVIVILDVTEKQKREEMRREFTSNVSHELKTPLTSIYGVSEMLMNGMVKPEDIRDFSRNIHEESGRLITLVNDILKLSQLDEGRAQAPKQPLDLYACAQDVIARLDSVARDRSVSMTLKGEAEEITGAPEIVSEMIYNLCDNAIKYNVEGGSVTVTVDRREDRPAVTVADTGIGIPKEHQDRVFERFYRVDKSHSRAIGGTGLGLSIVKHGADYHGAQIRMSSQVGKGTEISILF